MATGRTKKDRRRLFESGACMGRFCRQSVDPGHGEQFLEADGTWTRLCTRCAKKRTEECESPRVTTGDPRPTSSAANPD